MMRHTKFIAFDTNPRAQELCRELANRNDVVGIEVRGECTTEDLSSAIMSDGRTLIICDVEGAELELLAPAIIPQLLECDILVELHDFVSQSISRTVTERFAATHSIKFVQNGDRNPSDYAVLAAFHPCEQVLAVSENGARATWFAAALTPQAARKRWIATMKPRGAITVDNGAMKALNAGKSLLPAGVTASGGDFDRGDPVSILCDEGTQLGVGLSRYTAEEAAKIKGRKSTDIEEILGYEGRAALIHRDDMVLNDRKTT